MPSKKIKAILLTGMAVLTSLNLYAQSPGFVQTDVIKVSGITTPAQVSTLTLGNIQTTRVFIDGLGRPIQAVALQASPVSSKDIVQPEVYNTLGQQTTAYLPYTDNNAVNPSGSFRTTAVTDQLSYYQNSGTTANPNKVANETAYPFNQQLFENSPLQRVQSAGMVGTGFQPNTTNNHWKTVSYRLNNAASDGNILKWSTIGTFTAGNYYADNLLYVTDGTDEDNKETRSYTDAAGRMVLKRQLLAGAYLDTYYVYNNGGMISYIIPPLALAKMVSLSDYNLGDSPVNTMIFVFAYDGLGRLIEKTVPAKGKMSIVYDPLNRPVLMQDALMNSLNQWNYIRYDVKGRAISQGIYTDSNAGRLGRAAMQSYVNTLSYTTYYESRNTTQATGYYSESVFPTTTTGTLTQLAYAYYDDYKLNPSGTAYSYVSQGLTGEETATTAPVKGMPTMVRKTTVGAGLTSTWLLSVTFYDKRINAIQTQSNNQLYYTPDVLTDNKTSVPDFRGIPLTGYVKKVTGTSNTTSVRTTLTYDNMSRLSTVSQSYNGGASSTVAAYSYNEIGQMVQKNLGQIATGTIPANVSLSTYSATTAIATSSITLNAGFTVPSGSTFNAFISTGYLQTVDYRYNIRGQLLSINNSKLSNDGGLTNSDNTDLFGMQFLYDQLDGNLVNHQYFSGNLSAVKWMSKDNNGNSSYERAYLYNYDALNRDTSAVYAERTAGSTSSFTVTHGWDENRITYDQGGNLLTMFRNYASQGAGNHIPMDNLAYTYDPNNPNQLKSVTDATGNSGGFIGGTGNYIYDVNGNLKTDPYKGLSINYNFLNRTDKITVTAGTNQYINYTYDAGGSLIRKQQYNNGSLQTTTDYVDGFVYLTAGTGAATLSYFPMPEGRVLNNSGTLVQEFVITDQQGNARLSFQNNGSGTAVVKQENSYYAFGMILPNSPVATPATPNKQLYNGGSEWQNDYGNLPDYYQTFNRNYDAALGRWIGVDPVAESAESMTSYQYAGNNPVMSNDPNGDLIPYWHVHPDEPVERPSSNIWMNWTSGAGDEAIAGENAFMGAVLGGTYFSHDDAGGGDSGSGNFAGAAYNAGFDDPGKASNLATIFHYTDGSTLNVADGSNANFNVNSDGSLEFSGWTDQGGVDKYNYQTLSNFYGGKYAGLRGYYLSGTSVVGTVKSSKGANNSSFWPHLIGPGMILAGQPLLSKAFITPGASAGTSIASKVLSKAIPLQSSVRLWSPVIRDGGLEWVGTKMVGRFLGRWVPWVGWGLTAYDIYNNRQAIENFINDMQKENEQHNDDLLWHVH